MRHRRPRRSAHGGQGRAEPRPIPPDWALDAAGQPTTDPKAALAGTVLPFADPKGSGLAFMLDVLAGVLTGARFGAEVGSLYRDLSAPERCGHFLAAVSVESFLPLPDFRRRIAHYVGMFKACRPRAGVDEVLLPGEVERRREQAAGRDGVALSAATYAGLLDIAAARGVPLE